MTGRVVVIGSINVDETLPVASWPVPGETVLLDGPVRAGLGGKGANQAVAAALAGSRVTFVGAVGDDEGGSRAREDLDRHGVSVDRVRMLDGVTTGRATILVDRAGENLILVAPGANGEVSAEDVRDAAGAIAAADLVLVQGEVPPAAIDAAALACRETGTRFVLNLAPPVAVAAETLSLADPLVVNEVEAEALGIDAAQPSLERFVSVVVTRGGEGVVAASSEGRFEVASLSVPVVDTTGAGDAFAGTLVAALAEGASLTDACRAGSAAGAFAVTRPGASASYGDAAEVAAFAAGIAPRAD